MLRPTLSLIQRMLWLYPFYPSRGGGKLYFDFRSLRDAPGFFIFAAWRHGHSLELLLESALDGLLGET